MNTFGWLYPFKRWMYSQDRPNGVARFLNWISARQHSTGFLAPVDWVTLEVPGRRTGRLIECPVVVVRHDGGRYLVAMLGPRANWIRNVHAAGGRAVLRRRGAEAVRLIEVDPARRAPILRRYVALAPGARPHIPVDRRAPLADFERIAARFPVFQVVADPTPALVHR